MSQYSCEIGYSDEDYMSSLFDGGASMQLHWEHAAQFVPRLSQSSSSETLGPSSQSQGSPSSGAEKSPSNLFVAEGDRASRESSDVNFRDTPTPSAKRKLGVYLDDISDEEFGAAELDEDPELAALVEDSARKHRQNVQRKLFKTDTHPRRNLDPTTPTAHHRFPHQTPATTASSHSGGGDYPKIAEEVLSLLERQPLSEGVRQQLKFALGRHELRVRGVVRGRDVARQVLATQEEQIAELVARVAHLENSRPIERQSSNSLQ